MWAIKFAVWSTIMPSNSDIHDIERVVSDKEATLFIVLITVFLPQLHQLPD